MWDRNGGGSLRLRVTDLAVVIGVGAILACSSAVQAIKAPDFSARLPVATVHVRVATRAGAISIGEAVAGLSAIHILPGGDQVLIAAQRVEAELLFIGFMVTATPSDATMYADFAIDPRFDPLGGWIADEAVLEFSDANTGKLLAQYRAGGGFITPSVTTLVSKLAENVAADYETQLSHLGTSSRVRGRPPGSKLKNTSGTAFIVHPDGLLLTAHHVIDEGTSITVSCNGQPAVPAAVTSSSPAVDLALLEADGDLGTASFLRLSPQRVPSLGDIVFTVGYPTPDLLGTDPKYTNGTVSALSGLRSDASFLQISVPIQPGNSGGPLVNEDGEVVGVVVSTADAPAFILATDSIPQNINWAVKSVFASALFTPPSASVTSASAREDIIEGVTEATCLVRVAKLAQ